MASKNEETLKWLQTFEAGNRLITRLSVKKSDSKRTYKMYARHLKLWTEFSHLTPDETVEKWRKETKEDYEEALNHWDMWLDDFVAWLRKTYGWEKSTASYAHAAVKCLIKYNCRLRLTIGTTDRGIPKRIPPISLSDLIRMDEVASPQQRWILRGLKDSGMSREDFAELTYAEIKEDFEKGYQYVHMNVIRRKESVQYETWLGPNAVRSLKAYLNIRKERGEVIKNDTPLAVNEKTPHDKCKANSITQIIQRLGECVGVKTSPHKIRKLFESSPMTPIANPILVKYWMGHKIATNVESRYAIPNVDKQMELYEKAYAVIDVDKYGLEERVSAIEKLLSTMTQEQRERLIEKYVFKKEVEALPIVR